MGSDTWVSAVIDTVSGWFGGILEGLAVPLEQIATGIKSFKDSVTANGTNTLGKILEIRDNIINLPVLLVQKILDSELFQKIVDIREYIISLPVNLVQNILESDLFQKIMDIRENIINLPANIIKKYLESEFFSKIVDIWKTVIELPVKLPQLLYDKFKELLEYLFIPNDDCFDAFHAYMTEKFPLIESADSTINMVVDKLKGLGQTSPSFNVPLSKTKLARYGLTDLTISFEWFEPYRQTTHNIISAVLWVNFIFNQFFDLKNMIQGASSQAGASMTAIDRSVNDN